MGEEKRVELPFNDDTALVSTVHATFEVGELLAGTLDSPTATVGIAFDAPVSVEAVREGLLGLGDVVLFLQGSPVFDYESGVWAVVEDGGLIGVVDRAGAVSFPFLEPDVVGSLDGTDLTLSDIRAASAG